MWQKRSYGRYKTNRGKRRTMTANALPVSLLLFLLAPTPSTSPSSQDFFTMLVESHESSSHGFFVCLRLPTSWAAWWKGSKLFSNYVFSVHYMELEVRRQGRPTREKEQQQGPGRVIIINIRGRSRSRSRNRHPSCFMLSFGTVGWGIGKKIYLLKMYNFYY